MPIYRDIYDFLKNFRLQTAQKNRKQRLNFLKIELSKRSAPQSDSEFGNELSHELSFDGCATLVNWVVGLAEQPCHLP